MERLVVEEEAMKAIVTGIVLAILSVAGGARADGAGPWGGVFGPGVRWDRIEGTIVMPDGSGMSVGPMLGSARYRVAGEGKVVLYLQSGFLFVRVEGLSWGLHYQNGPLGASVTGDFVGTVVCDSTQRFGFLVSVDTPVLQLKQGAVTYAGVVALPQACRDRPEEIVFLLRHVMPGNPVLDGTFVAYGAGRVVF
jgi:hypothetical protein